MTSRISKDSVKPKDDVTTTYVDSVKLYLRVCRSEKHLTR
jgi:hypothetical protein